MINLRMNLRIKVFIIAVFIIVLGQVGFSIKNVEIFQKSYISTLKAKYEKLAFFLKDDVEKILSIGIPLTKMIKIEGTLHGILKSGKELNFIEITDNNGYMLYFADHNTMKQIKKKKRKALLYSSETINLTHKYGLTQNDTNIVLPIMNPRKKIGEGYINLHISPQIIVSRSNQIFLDAITVILTSMLITFEFLGFFVAYEISSPLENLSRTMSLSIKKNALMPEQSFMFMDELYIVVEKLNDRMLQLQQHFAPVASAQKYFPKIKASFDPRITKQLKLINIILKKQKKISETDEKSEKEKSLVKTYGLLKRIQETANIHSENLKSFSFDYVKGRKVPITSNTIHYVFIRPLIFLFLMADGFCISFLPMFIDSLYQPVSGLPKEVILALPISLFMFVLAVGMPISGEMTDKHGWYKPLITGILINAAGHFMTGFSMNLFQLVIFRCITAIGFAMVFMSCQRFVIDNTNVEKRAMGMSSFIAAFFSGDICGTVIGGMLVDHIGYSWIFFLSGFFSILAFLVTLFIFHQFRGKKTKTLKTSDSRVSFSLKKIFKIFNDREFCAVLFFQAIPAKMVLVGFLFYFVPLYLQEINILPSDIGRIIICYSLSLVFLGPLFSKYLDKENLRKYYILFGGIITGISLLTFQIYPGGAMVLGIVLLVGMAHTFSMSSQAALISETAFVHSLGPGTGMGIFRFWERVGNVIGPLIMGYFISTTGYLVSMSILGGVTLLCSLIYLLLINGKRRKK